MPDSFGLSKEELSILKKLNTPRKIQEFINKIPINFEEKEETCLSPRMVLKQNKAHCMEGAMLAALALRIHGYRPLLVDLTANKYDEDHVITVFKQKGGWGAISKTNHCVLRYRDPVYKTIRELVMSFFHEYFDDKGRKNLRTYTQPVNLARFDPRGWMTSEENVWYIPDYLAEAPHLRILSRSQISRLKKPDPIELESGSLREWKRKEKSPGTSPPICERGIKTTSRF